MAVNTKIALVTGGSRGLGKNMAIAIAKKGLDVIITYNSKKDEADAVVKEIESLGQKAASLQLNVGDSNTFDGFFEGISSTLKSTFNTDKFDFLVNNAGIGIHNSFVGTTEAEFDQLTNIQFKGPFFLTQKALNVMNDGGGIVNISTGLARFSFPGYSAYASMKGAIETLTKYQAKELGERKIRANVVAPGAIETDFGGGAVRDNEQLNQHIASITALGRVGLPDDIGGVVAFLCTEDAKWVNAQRIEASGGMNL
ncbi:NAD(P)-dependent dehydrogenase (short-subunit alcohol dehydrogenase family) [Flavobacterium sp. 2755]|uniref:SDR family oxidoreductase n=1 Tax=Flavobacterium sp. 2755 TaxID=2817765 RepID=UPI002859F7ED|nr:SDR family oxidoreductase [Flavobacterium sp. 2755]MDR6763286.1 NAD(P)-dependent dehydrogenase (short-subunit alcohol dehydrogenase family) [Flavobacterium sp. 2755]